ncbi:S8 family serine peptidase [Roseateles amylovorans]|uniref:S8 family serine peptidase n=1 Tax=Roseateles amylovorans TaxID=2978473 RepID=A0ABY6B5Q0_9BURK|nr:S8 family serine peptidase [Roseateles amylovorans]UXH80731.1 S8 family serine peptidase [Roseateles amylovorans]
MTRAMNTRRLRRRMLSGSAAMMAPLLMIGVSLPAAAQNRSLVLRESADAVDVIHGALLSDGKTVTYTARPMPVDASTRVDFKKDKPEPPRELVRDKLNPRLQRLLEKDPSATALLVVNFRDHLTLPLLPEPDTDKGRDAEVNQAAMKRADALLSEFRERRDVQQRELVALLSDRYGGKVRERFWLVNAMAVEMPLRMAKELSSLDDVLSIELDDTGTIPPQNANSNDDVQDGRARMVSDPYFGLGLTGGWIGLLDTGARFTHNLFNSPSHIDFRLDCVNGGANCNSGSGFNPNDDCWDHGTSSAAIISGNNRSGDAFRGVTGITLDSFKVYPTTFNSSNLCTGNLSVSASVRGFQRAVAVLDRVIVAEMQAGGSDTGTISVAADNAFDAGAVIIAANGNNGSAAATVNEPAIAHKVIGVGNFDVQTGNQVDGQSRGPAPDNRIKPDIQAPTNTETASNGCGWKQNCTSGGSDTGFRVFGGTSGATPYAAGAAALLRNWLRGTSFSIDPGQVYAQLILSGQQPYPFNNTSGAGKLNLPINGWAWWGKVTITHGGTIDIPIEVSGGSPNNFDAALWWPETASQAHNDVDLSLIDPSGVVRGSSVSIPSVFERVRAAGAVPSGQWKVRVRGYNVPTGGQTVYWAAHVRLK